MSKRILVTGSSGFVGKNLYLRLGKESFVTGISRNDLYFTDDVVDIRDRERLHSVLDDRNPKVVIHCAYNLHVDGCEVNPLEAAITNIEGTNNVVDWCKERSRKLVFMSTDYVYSLNGNVVNDEKSPVGSLNVYTSHKIENEQYIRKNLKDYLIIRSGFIYGYDKKGLNFLMQMINSEGNMKVPEDQIISPTNVDYLTESIEGLLNGDFVGIYNCNGNESLSRFDFANKISDVLKLKFRPTPILTKDIENKAPRPLSCVVDSSLIQIATGIIPLSNNSYLKQIEETLTYY